MTSNLFTDEHAVVIVGAGQTGLATAYGLGRRGIAAVVLDAHARVGDQWRQRYDSPAAEHPEPVGRPARHAVPGRPLRVAHGNSRWATTSRRTRTGWSWTSGRGMPVRDVDRTDDCRWAVSADGRRLDAETSCWASGGERFPKGCRTSRARSTPASASCTPAAYRNPTQLLPGPFAGGGASQSGADLAVEVRRSRATRPGAGERSRVRSRSPWAPVRPGGAAPFLWFIAQHVLTPADPDGPQGSRRACVPEGTPLVRFRTSRTWTGPVYTGSRPAPPVCKDGDAGARRRHRCWTWRTCCGAPGSGRTSRRCTPRPSVPTAGHATWAECCRTCPRLYFMGLLFQRGFYSMLIGGAGRDAAHIARHLAKRERALARTRGRAAAAPANASV